MRSTSCWDSKGATEALSDAPGRYLTVASRKGARGMTRYIDVNDVSKLVREVGVTRVLASMASYIEQDYRRWHTFEKTARLASHSSDGVIELMPTSDAKLYSFKYVN